MLHRNRADRPSDKWVRWGNYFKNFVRLPVFQCTENCGMSKLHFERVCGFDCQTLGKMHNMIREWASRIHCWPEELVFLTRVSNFHLDNHLFTQSIWPSFQYWVPFWQVATAQVLRLCTIIGIAGNLLSDSMEMLSPVRRLSFHFISTFCQKWFYFLLLDLLSVT